MLGTTVDFGGAFFYDTGIVGYDGNYLAGFLPGEEHPRVEARLLLIVIGMGSARGSS